MLGGGGARPARVAAIGEDDPIPPDDRVAAAQRSDEIERLYRQSAVRLANQLARHGAMADERMDFVHEAFARLLGRSGCRSAAIASPGAYLARISRNLLHDRGRSACVRDGFAQDLATRAAGHHDPIVHLESRDRLRRLEAAILRLKPLTREIFLAQRLDGLSYAEIAALTGLSPKSVERHMSKAIAKIMRLMDRG